ncbi:hypothetical protein AB0H73_23280 [Streptomyces olivoreticuli]
MSNTPTNDQGESGLDRALQSVTEALGKTDVKAGGCSLSTGAWQH